MLESFLGNHYNLTAKIFDVRLKLGFGPAITVKVRAVAPTSCPQERLRHKHLVYQWPLRHKQATEKQEQYHQVFPAVLVSTDDLKDKLHHHLGRLVGECFDDFPTHRSQLKVLRPFHTFYKTLPDGEPRRLIKEAFKLLVLVHIGGDFHMDATDNTSRLIVRHFFEVTGESSCPDSFDTCPRDMGNFPTPCFIRGQFGLVMPQMAHEMMVSILNRVERMSLSQKCEMWPYAIVTFGLLLMAVESIDYHAEKVSFHADLDTARARSQSEPTRCAPCGLQPALDSSPSTGPPRTGRANSDQACEQLVGFYRRCFPNCHRRLTGPSDTPGRKRSGSAAAAEQQEAQNTLIAELRSALSNAEAYLMEKGSDVGKTEDDLSFYFDRKLAKFFLPNLGVAF